MTNLPDLELSARDLFDIDVNFTIPSFSKKTEYVPEVDEAYSFDEITTKAVIAGFKYNKRVLIHGLHGTGKSSHIEQIAARLNWPLIRINLDGFITRFDLIGRDIITIKDNKQITEFKDGIIPFALKEGVALLFDEYDAARPELMFILQRLLEKDGKFTLIDQNMVITPHPNFRIFATSNTIGLGDVTGMYHGTNLINQGQIDRWNIVTILNYLSSEKESSLITKKYPNIDKQLVSDMVTFAWLTRKGFELGDISILMSPRTIINWIENYEIFGDIEFAFNLTFLNKCEEFEKPIIAEYYQKVFDQELKLAA